MNGPVCLNDEHPHRYVDADSYADGFADAKSGSPHAVILRAIQADIARRRKAGDDVGADALADFADRLGHWCSSHLRLP